MSDYGGIIGEKLKMLTERIAKRLGDTRHGKVYCNEVKHFNAVHLF